MTPIFGCGGNALGWAQMRYLEEIEKLLQTAPERQAQLRALAAENRVQQEIADKERAISPGLLRALPLKPPLRP